MFRVFPSHTFGAPVRGTWHVIGDDLVALNYRMSTVEWALFDRWRSVWTAAA